MHRFKQWLRVVVLSMVLIFASAPAPVFAAGIFDDACNGQSDSATCDSVTKPNSSNPLTGSDGVLLRVARIIAIIAGLTAIIVIIVAGFSYMTADGDPQKAKKARDALVGALVGIVIIALASVIITFVVNSSGVQ